MTKVLNRKPTNEEMREQLILNGMDAGSYSIWISEPPLRDPDFQYQDDLFGFVVDNKLVEYHKLLTFGLDEKAVRKRLERIEEPMKELDEKLRQERPELFEGE